MEENQEKLTACGNCKNINTWFLCRTIPIPRDYEQTCNANPITVPFDPIYGENYVTGYKTCREINDGHCPNFIIKKEEVIKPLHQEKRWWQFWK